MNKLFLALLAISGILLLIFLLGLVLSFPVMWLWNWLMPVIFHLPSITLMQAWGLFCLCGLLFKSSSTSSSKKD